MIIIKQILENLTFPLTRIPILVTLAYILAFIFKLIFNKNLIF